MMMNHLTSQELAREFWIAAHFLARRTCSGYASRGCSQPQTPHEVGVFSCQVRPLFKAYLQRAVEHADCPPEDFWREVQESEGWMYGQNHQQGH